jgi:hypothetical protein
LPQKEHFSRSLVSPILVMMLLVSPVGEVQGLLRDNFTFALAAMLYK